MDEAVGQHRLSWQTARIDALQALTPRVMRVVRCALRSLPAHFELF